MIQIVFACTVYEMHEDSRNDRSVWMLPEFVCFVSYGESNVVLITGKRRGRRMSNTLNCLYKINNSVQKRNLVSTVDNKVPFNRNVAIDCFETFVITFRI